MKYDCTVLGTAMPQGLSIEKNHTRYSVLESTKTERLGKGNTPSCVTQDKSDNLHRVNCRNSFASLASVWASGQEQRESGETFCLKCSTKRQLWEDSDNPMRRHPVKPHISENCAVPTKENYGTMHKLQYLTCGRNSHISLPFLKIINPCWESSKVFARY